MVKGCTKTFTANHDQKISMLIYLGFFLKLLFIYHFILVEDEKPEIRFLFVRAALTPVSLVSPFNSTVVQKAVGGPSVGIYLSRYGLT